MPHAPTSTIYTGIWVNWARGYIRGATLTLGPQASAVLTAFIATFIAVASTQLWRISCFLVHRYNSTSDKKDGLHHQHQVILRNTSAPDDTLWLYLKQAYRWRGFVRRPIRRAVVYLLFSFVFVAATAVLSILIPSAIVAYPGSERLIRSNECGWWDKEDGFPQKSQSGFEQKTLKDCQSAAAYTQSCYRSDLNNFQCSVYEKPVIDWNATRDVKCPFQASACYPEGSHSYKMDTGFFNSHGILGINAPWHETVNFRRVTTCSNLVSEPYAHFNKTEGIQYYFYGVGENVTYTYNVDAALATSAYTVQATFADLEVDSPLTPVKALRRTDADVSVVFIAPNGVQFEEPCHDYAFTATRPWQSLYLPDYYVSVIGCADQYQFCNPNNDKCTGLTGLEVANIEARESLALSKTQQGIRNRIQYAQLFSGVTKVINRRSLFALRASESFSYPIQAPLPDNQWEIESAYWFETGLARLQQQIHEYAAGPGILPPHTVIVPPYNTVDREMCHMQKVQLTNGTTSFSILGIILTFSIGGCIILMNISSGLLASLYVKCYSRVSSDSRATHWARDGILQLQCALFRERGIFTPGSQFNEVPTTGGDSLFTAADVHEDEHLMARRDPSGEIERVSKLPQSRFTEILA